MNQPAIKPLGPIGMELYPFLKLLARGNDRELLRLRWIAGKRRQATRRALRKLRAELEKEAKVFQQLLIGCYTRLGYAYTPHQEHQHASGGKKNRVQRIRFEVVKTSAEIIYYRVLTRRKTLLGFKNALPYRVWVSDLIRDETLQELSYACERVVSAVYADPRKGAWIRVHRLEGVGGLPIRVMFKDMLEHFPRDMGKATVILGIGEHRKVHTFDLGKHPHMLIGGPTGGGKSNMVNTIIASQIRLQSPEMFKFVLIDLKRMEFSFYEDCPHLLCPVIFDPDKAIEKLKELMSEVSRRADMLTGKAKELSAWNQKFPAQAMPRIVVVIDEFAELMLASGQKVAKETERLITRITNLGRAVGIHLIVCTQRPSVAVVSGAIRTNMAVTVCGKTPNKTQSAVIIGVGDAAELPDIPGRMMYALGAAVTPIQSPLITDDDVIESVKIARGKADGVIRIEGSEPVAVPEGIAVFAVHHTKGSLGAADLATEMSDRAVSRAMLKNAIDELVKVGAFEVAGNIYAVEPHGDKGYRVRLAAAWESDDVPEITEVEITVPAPEILALPAKIEAPVVVEFNPIDVFIAECCETGPYRVPATPLYMMYTEWCANSGVQAVNQHRFGDYLSSKGFRREKQGIVWRKGIRLKQESGQSGQDGQSEPTEVFTPEVLVNTTNELSISA